VYLTVDSLPDGERGPVGIGVTVQPLVSWMWVGGGVLVVGAALAALPGRRRRRPTDPVSAPAIGVGRPADSEDRDLAPDEGAASAPEREDASVSAGLS
jgi:cytochrome c-type biogenesis protein CcmF